MFSLFNKKIKPTRILICSIAEDGQFDQLARSDADVYRKHYPNVVVEHLRNGEGLFQLIRSNEFDVVHLLASINDRGDVRGTNVQDILANCKTSCVKVLFWATNNNPDVYIRHVKAGPFNMVMVIERKEACFANFLDRLLELMSKGYSMPMSWVKLVPQSPNAPEHETAPVSIFQAGCGNMVFLP